MIEISEKKLAGPIIRLHPNDNIVVARIDVGIGTEVPSEGFTSRSQVPAGYKIAAKKILKGEPILKYNVTVGFANTDIEPGTMVHSHNTEFREFDREHPEVYLALRRLAYEWVSAGRAHLGIATLYERLRWEWHVNGLEDRDGFKLNNNILFQFVAFLNPKGIKFLYSQRKSIKNFVSNTGFVTH